MQVLSFFAVYFVLWWLCLFMVLPFGVRGQHLDGKVTNGTEPGAPIRAHLGIKMLVTTLLAFVLLFLLNWGLSNEALQNYWNR